MAKGSRIIVVDAGIGNLRSVQKAFEHLGVTTEISDRPDVVLTGDGVILPGVGAFGDGISNLKARGLDSAVREVVNRGIPFFGICVGLQLLFEESDEMGKHTGLGVLPGRVVRFPAGLTAPHMGWNQIEVQQDSHILRGIEHGSFVYFAHSYHAVTNDASIVVATTTHGNHFPSVLVCGNVWAIQFHPEKSQDVGLKILSNFLEYVNDSISSN